MRFQNLQLVIFALGANIQKVGRIHVVRATRVIARTSRLGVVVFIIFVRLRSTSTFDVAGGVLRFCVRSLFCWWGAHIGCRQSIISCRLLSRANVRNVTGTVRTRWNLFSARTLREKHTPSAAVTIPSRGYCVGIQICVVRRFLAGSDVCRRRGVLLPVSRSWPFRGTAWPRDGNSGIVVTENSNHYCHIPFTVCTCKTPLSLHLNGRSPTAYLWSVVVRCVFSLRLSMKLGFDQLLGLPVVVSTDTGASCRLCADTRISHSKRAQHARTCVVHPSCIGGSKTDSFDWYNDSCSIWWP